MSSESREEDFLTSSSGGSEEEEGKDYEQELREAAEDGRLEDVQRLLAREDVDVDARSPEEGYSWEFSGWSALHFACYEGRELVMMELLRSGADPNVKTMSGATPLVFACQTGPIQVVRELIRHGADVNIRAEGSVLDTPLHFEYHGWNDERCAQVARILIENHANVDARNKYGQTPLHCASENGLVQTARVLIEHNASIEAKDKSGQTPLFVSSRHGRAEVTAELIRSRANVNARADKESKAPTPLHAACETGDISTVRALLASNAVLVNAKDNSGRTPLHDACSTWRRGTRAIVRLLIDRGAEVNARCWLDRSCWYGETPAHSIAFSANGEPCHRDGCTPLHHACWSGYGEVVRVLLDRGARIDMENIKLETPYALAKRNKETLVVRILQEHLWNRFQLVKWAAEGGRLEKFQQSLEPATKKRRREE